MQFYKTVGVAVALSQSGVSAASTLVTIVANGSTFNCPLTVEASRQTTKNGTVRVMLKASLTHPRFTYTASDWGTLGVSATTSGTETSTAHAVFTAAPSLVVGARTDYWQSGVATILQNLLGAIVATTGNDVSLKATSVGVASPIWQGISGIFPLNLASGVYGAAT